MAQLSVVAFARPAQAVSPGATLLRHWQLLGGTSAMPIAP
jgi:hypothetical protein